jgi:hypothetical protein
MTLYRANMGHASCLGRCSDLRRDHRPLCASPGRPAVAGQATTAHLRLLFRSGADIGGARPKTHFRRADSSPWIAKFRAWGDAFDDPRMECVCLGLARACGIEVPDHDLVDVAGRSVLLVRRFDRAGNGGRLGYMSAATLTGTAPSSYTVDTSHAELANQARASSPARPSCSGGYCSTASSTTPMTSCAITPSSVRTDGGGCRPPSIWCRADRPGWCCAPPEAPTRAPTSPPPWRRMPSSG